MYILQSLIMLYLFSIRKLIVKFLFDLQRKINLRLFFYIYRIAQTALIHLSRCFFYIPCEGAVKKNRNEHLFTAFENGPLNIGNSFRSLQLSNCETLEKLFA